MLTTSENQNYESLVKTMLENSGEFSKLWNEQYTVSLDPVDFTLTHPRFAQLRLKSTCLLYPRLAESTVLLASPADKRTETTFEKLLLRDFVILDEKGRVHEMNYLRRDLG
jgi:hypothetical protein